MEKKEEQVDIEEGACILINPEEETKIYSLTLNSDNSKNKLFISLNYQDKTKETEFVSLYTDLEFKNLFQELKHTNGINNTFAFDIPSNQKLFLKSNFSSSFLFYYKYCTQDDITKINNIKKELKVKILEKKGNDLKISFDAPYEKEVDFSIKYTIYVSEGKKRYRIFKDRELKGAQIMEGKKMNYEADIKLSGGKKEQFVYVVAEPKDAGVNVRPKFIYTGEKIQETSEGSSDTIINIILIIAIICTLIYKYYKRKKKAEEQQAGKMA